MYTNILLKFGIEQRCSVKLSFKIAKIRASSALSQHDSKSVITLCPTLANKRALQIHVLR